jgi:hypothetical protein
MNQTKRGGARPGAGRKKGPQRLEKEAARELVRALVLAKIDTLVEAQIANAMGIKYLVVREKRTGKFLRVGSKRAGALKDDEEIIEVWEKDPSIHAFSDLLNRAIDKPAEQVQEIKLTGEVTIVARLQAARKRLIEARSAE